MNNTSINSNSNDIKRNSNIEALRILCIIMIIFSHYSVHGVMNIKFDNAYEYWRLGSSFNRAITSLMSPGGGFGVGIFFSITGYYSIYQNKIKLKKIFKVVIFYSLLTMLIYIIASIGGIQIELVNKSVLFHSLFNPITGGQWWFVASYVFLQICKPGINQLFDRFDKKNIVKVIFLFWLFDYIIGYFGAVFYQLQKAIFFYMVGAYIRKYSHRPTKAFIPFGIAMYCASGALQYTIAEGILPASVNKILSNFSECVVIPICVVLIFTVACHLPKSYNSKINAIAGYVFGIFLFHDSKVMRDLYWNTIFQVKRQFTSNYMFLMAIGTVLAVFFIGLIVDVFRTYFDKVIITKAIARLRIDL